MIQTGSRGYQALRNFLTEQADNRYAQIIQALGVTETGNGSGPGAGGANIPRNAV